MSTGDKRRFLWDKGGNTLSVLDVATLDFVDYQGFWIHREKKRPIRGLIGLGSSDCSLIFATGFEGSHQILIFHRIDQDRIYKTISSEYTSLITTWTTCESSRTDEHFFVGGLIGDTPTIGAIRFNESMSPISFSKLSKLKSKTLSKIKRIEGSDILMVGMIQDLLIIRFVNDSEFSILHSFSVFSDYEIIAILFHSQFIFTLSLGDHSLQVIEFKDSVNQAEFSSTEFKEPLRVSFLDMKMGGQRRTISPEKITLGEDKEISNYLANDDITYNVVSICYLLRS